jgi:hypothetical protein
MIKEDRQRFYYQILTGIQLSLFVRLILGNFTHGWNFWFWFLMAAFVVSIETCMRSEGIVKPLK